jgi:hypothetical protein
MRKLAILKEYGMARTGSFENTLEGEFLAKRKFPGWVWWLISVIPAIQETEIG